MPRRRRIPKGRIGGPDSLTPDQRGLLLNPFGQLATYRDARHAADPLLYGGRVAFANPDEARAAWEIHADDLIEEYQTTHPGEQPWPVETWGA